jgi:hypothetical protein
MCYTLNLPCPLMRENQIETDLLAVFLEESIKDAEMYLELTANYHCPNSSRREATIIHAKRFLRLLMLS